jgi:hypothetical protein
MRLCTMILSAALSVLLVSTDARDVHADEQACCGGYGYGFAPYNVYAGDSIPYFSAHPPVYYSAPVPRPYGYSPFAYPGWMKTPAHQAVVKPVTIINPYVEQPAKTKTAGRPNFSSVKVVINPYVSSPVAISQQIRQ